jgi:hypothetical protein
MESQSVLIHVRFAPNGVVVEISERPPALSPQEWFNGLCDNASDVYQPLAGGRGLFRLTRAVVDVLKAESTSHAA